MKIGDIVQTSPYCIHYVGVVLERSGNRAKVLWSLDYSLEAKWEWITHLEVYNGTED